MYKRQPLGDTAANHKRRQAALRVLRLALQQELTPRQRQCMELCVLQGLSQVEAGRQLGVNKATVCRHLQKAKRALRRLSLIHIWCGGAGPGRFPAAAGCGR